MPQEKKLFKLCSCTSYYKIGIILFLFLFTLLKPTKLNSQTTLNPGDMAFLGFNTAGTFDAISFVTFVDLLPNTVFYFSDCPYKSGAFCTGGLEHCIQFTTSSYVIAGTLITYDDSQSYPTAPTPTLSSNLASCSAITAAFSATATAGNNPGLNSKGDNGFIFQGSYASPTFVCAIKNGSNWKSSGSASCSSTDDAELPATLTNGTTALYTGNGSCKGIYYNCSSVPSTTTSASSSTFNNTSNWTCDGSGVNLPTILSPCNFSLTIAPCVLPVELNTFIANTTTYSIELNWTTSSEANNNFFTVEKSLDGSSFSQLIKIKGTGNSQSIKNYKTVDQHPTNGINYYRLKQTDFNGNYKYFSIIKVFYEGYGQTVVKSSIKPNPATESITVDFYTENPTTATIVLTNYMGTLVLTQTIETIKGTNSVELSLKEMPIGVYFLSISGLTTEDNKVLKLIKQ